MTNLKKPHLTDVFRPGSFPAGETSWFSTVMISTMMNSATGLLPNGRGVRWLSLAILSTIAFGIGSCSESTQSEASSAATTDELQVVTTFLPMTQFTKAVVGDRAEVTQLLPANIAPHDYQAKPGDVQRLTQADVLVQNGLEMEEFLEDLVANAENQNLKIIDSSEGVTTISSEDVPGHTPGHASDHDRAGEEQDHPADEHSAEENSKEEHHGKFNPHIWLDPKRAIQQVENIRDGLIAADAAGQAEYTANAAAYITQLQALDAEITSTLQPFAGKTFVAFHDFAPYFAQSYGLKAVFLVDIPEQNPAPEDVRRVMEEVKQSHLKTILTEPQAGESTFASLAKDLNVQISTFDPMETGVEPFQPEYYLTTMRQNVEILVTAFAGKP